jgi:hypothetical protein
MIAALACLPSLPEHLQKMSAQRWNTAELLDLEFFLHQDEGEDMERLATRDRAICLTLPVAVSEQPNVLLRSWLASRRAAETTALPGALWQELFVLLSGAAALAGLSSGAGLAFSLLAYSGTQPVNVAAYFAIFVLLQLTLILLLTASIFCSNLRGISILESSLLYRLTGRLFFWLLERCTTAGRRATSRISAETRMNWAAHANSFKSLRQRHGLLFLRPFFLLAQLFGISFNLGVLATTLLKVIGSDLAFGWQTTLQIDAAAVHALVAAISLPWSWLPNCIPSLAQIEGSRLILKDGIYHLANQNLTSWWPFLCLSVLSYGLLPRLALFSVGIFRQRKELAQFDMQQGRFRQIFHRMRTPLVSTAARTEERQSSSEEKKPTTAEPPDDEQLVSADRKLPPVIALIPDELATVLPFAAVAEQLRCRAGQQLRQIVPFWTLDRSEEEELVTLKTAMTTQGCADVVILHEAWQPPVQELLTWLGLLRRTIGPQAMISITLIGRPAADSLLTSAQPEHLRIWRQKIAIISDSGLHVIELVK